MLWNRTLLILLVVLTISVDSKYLGLPDPIKYISVTAKWERMSNDSREPVAFVKWQAYETDTTYFVIEFVGVNDGKSINTMVHNSFMLFFRQYHSGNVRGLKINETYIVRVFAVNALGKSPPSPDIIFFMDESQMGGFEEKPRLSAPDLFYQSRLGNKVNVDWLLPDFREYEDKDREKGPIEYTFRYGDDKNTTLWTTLKTNDTRITLEDLEHGNQYSGYVSARKGNLTSLNPYFIPISVDQDMSGLPEPVIRIEPSYKNGVFAPGDPMTIICSVPPNSYVWLYMNMNDDVVVRQKYLGLGAWDTILTHHTTANETVNSAECETWNGMSRKSRQSWIVKKSLDSEYLQRRNEEIEADKKFLRFRKI